MDPASGNVHRDESSLPIVQVLYDFKPNDVAVDIFTNSPFNPHSNQT